MKLRLKIRQKIILFVLTTSAFLYVVAIGYIVMSSRQAMLADANKNAVLTAREVAGDIERDFERDLALTRTLTQAFSIYQKMPVEQWQKLFLEMYYPVLDANPHVYSIWDSWEFYGYVPGYTKDYGRFVNTVWREGGQLKHVTETRSVDGDPNLYGGFKKGGVENLWEPYFDEGLRGKAEVVLMTTISSPVTINGRYMGLVGLDVSLEALQKLVSGVKPVQGSYAFIVSNKSLIAGHSDTELINKNLADVWSADFEKNKIGEKVQKGEEFTFTRIDEKGKEYLVIFSPIKPGYIPSPWSLALVIPVDVILASANQNLLISLLVGIVGLFILIFVLIFVSNNVTKPIANITNILNRLSKGEIDDSMTIQVDSGDEIEQMAKALNISIEGLRNKTLFAKDIEQGALDSELELLSGSDVLGKSLIEMQQSLKRANEEETIRKQEDLKRTWANEGFALFADVLRRNNSDLQKLSDEVTRNLVKYVGANQGGIFLLNDEEKNDEHFELVSTFAWDRKKYLTKRIEKGEGLVGACALERETIFITEVPDEYVEITSGLGSANPRCVVLVPLKHEEQVLGVIEMASFKILEPFEVEFLEKVAESIASTILAVRINARTRYLLEQSQQQAEEMAAQEEEMRQNMEELQATQEEAARKASEMEEFVSSLNSSAFVIEYDMNGNIISVNDSYLHRVGVAREQLVGSHHTANIEMTEKQKKEYNQFWTTLKSGFSQKMKSKLKFGDKEFVFLETYVPITDGDGRVYKILKLAYDIDEFK